MKIIFSNHAVVKIGQRNIQRGMVIETALSPDFARPAHRLREERYKHFGKNWLKAIIIKENDTIVVITAHWVAKINKN